MLSKILDKQYRRPSGLLGRIIGDRMVRDHQPENLWTISVLQPQPTDAILEVGFGAGFAIQELSKTVAYIAGVDFSKTMVRAASRRNKLSISKGKVTLKFGDSANLPFENEFFDKTFSIHSIYFWPDPMQALKEMGRVLKPTGKIVLTVLPKYRWNEHNPDMPIGTSECKPYSGEELEQMLGIAGFSQIKIVADTNPHHRSNFCVVGIKL